MNADQSIDPEGRRHEYTEAGQNFRHYSALRFVIFSIYVALIAALGGIALGLVGESRPSEIAVRVAAGGAILATYVFYACETACMKNRRYFRDVMVGLEEHLPHRSMTNFPKNTLLQPKVAFRVFFAVNAVFWTSILISGNLWLR